MRRNHVTLKRRAFTRDSYTCQLALVPECLGDMRTRYERYLAGQLTRRRCGLSVDHKRPLAKGGKWTLENLQTACMPCNGAKGDTVLADDTMAP